MSLLTWNFDKHFIYVIIYWILEIIYRIFLSFKEYSFKITKKAVHDEYILIISSIIGDLFAGFLVLYIKCISKSQKKEILTAQNDILIYTKLDKLKKNFYIKLIIIVIIDYISRSSSWISYAITDVEPNEVSHAFKNTIKITLDIIMRYIYSVFILKIVVYKHRIFSMILIGLGLVLLITNNTLLMKYGPVEYNIGNSFLFTVFASISGYTYPIEDTIAKQIFLEDYIYPASFQFYRGIAESILILIITPILYFSFGEKLELNNDNININILLIIINTLASFFKAFITFKIIYHYSSQSVSFLRISQSFGGSITIFINLIKKGLNDEWTIIFIIIEIFSVIMILFASLIYDEIIIINKCELNKNVKLGIINRGEFDTLYINGYRDSQLDENLFDIDIDEIYSNDKENNENEDDNKE